MVNAVSDYIERGALMDKIEEQLACLREVDRNYYTYMNGYEDCYCEVKEAPAADVAPVRHGRWKYKRTTEDGFAIVECTECGEEAFAIAYFVKGKDYCLNCGAKMDGGDGDATD